jgi:pantothenate kinase
MGDNRTIDMLVGDIYGGMDYSKVYVNLDLHSFCYWDM